MNIDRQTPIGHCTNPHTKELIQSSTYQLNRSIIICLFLFYSLILKSQVVDSTKAAIFGDSAWKAYKKYYFRKSISLLDSSILYNPTNSFSYKLKAEAQWFLGNYADAAETYRKMISLGDENLLKVSAYVFLGMLYGKAEKPRLATEQYATAVMLWESGYVPHKQFRMEEEFDYFLALAFLEDKVKARKILSDRNLDSLSYPKRHELEIQYKRCLSLFDKTPNELLEEYFKEYLLPTDIKPLEE